MFEDEGDKNLLIRSLGQTVDCLHNNSLPCGRPSGSLCNYAGVYLDCWQAGCICR